jgi:hypothetical protein
MGCDFAIGVQNFGDPELQLIHSSEMSESTLRMSLDEEKLNQHMARFPEISENRGSWYWSVPEGGSLDITIDSPLISIDTHADWLAVLEVYLYIRSIEPKAFLFSDSSDTYNEKTFRDFIFAPKQTLPRSVEKDFSNDELNRLVDALEKGDRNLGLGLLSLGNNAVSVLPRLIGLINKTSEVTQLDVINIVSAMGGSASDAVPKLVSYAEKSIDPVFRRYVFMALGKIGVSDSNAISLLANCYQSAEIFDQLTILKSLLQIKQDDLAVPLLLDMIEKGDTSPPANWASAFSDLFLYVNDKYLVQQKLVDLLQQTDPKRRLVAAIAMDALAKRHQSGESLVDVALQDDWARVRRIATTTLSRLIRTDSVAKKLNVCEKDQDEEVRARAMWAKEFGVIESFGV